MTDIKGDLWKGAKNPRVRPWVAVVTTLPASIASHLAWGDSPVAAVGMTVAAGTLTAATWWAGQGTSAARRIHATASTAAASGYMVVATITDPLSAEALSTLILGGTVAAGSWNLRQALRGNPDAQGSTGGSSETGLLVKALGDAKARLRKPPEVEPNKVTAPLQLTDITPSELSHRVEAMAVELGISPNSIRIQTDPDDAARPDLVIVPQDMLKQPSDWPGPSALGKSITEPIVIGVYEDGAEAVLWFPAGDGRNATHYLTAGMNGSGKSAGQSVAITEALTRNDSIVWAVDPSKGMQTFGPFLPYLDWVEMTTSGGEAMIAALSDVITARANALGAAGFKNWAPQAFAQLDMPYMVVWIEEAAKFFRSGTEMEGLVMEARSAGISVIISLQRPSASSMPTDVREQLGGVLCFGVKGRTTASMALPDDVVDAGARPESWENRRPGYAYLVAPGVDEERYATPLRTYRIDDDDITGALAIAPRPSADPVTAAAAGEAYANRTRYDADDALTSTDAPVEVQLPPSAEQDREAADDAKVARELAAASGFSAEDIAAGGDPDAEIPPIRPDRVWSLTGPTKQAASRDLSTEQAMDELMALLEEFREQDLETIGPKDFRPHWGKGNRLDRGRSWLSPRLTELADEGVHLAETDKEGVYRLLYPEPATV